MQSPFSSPEDFRSAFEIGLTRLLNDHEELGVYILVLANACFDPKIRSHLSTPLQIKFAKLSEDLIARQNNGLESDDVEDDVEVFRQLLEMRSNHLCATESRLVGPWELQYNQLRSLRPPRATNELIEGISAPFDRDQFHFAKPFLQKEIFWQGELSGRKAALFYNKFPFVELHCLLVPESREEYPQFLRREDHEYTWDLVNSLEASLPGVGFGYNSYGAYASVNHLHFQMFIREQPMAIAAPNWHHNGGQEKYPAVCHCFESAISSWDFIEELHKQDTAYNLIYLPGRLFCLPRPKQGSRPSLSWSSGFAWHEMAGGFTAFNRDDFMRLGVAELEQSLAGASIDGVPDS